MATIVPVSHSAKWRARSRGSSVDLPEHHTTSGSNRRNSSDSGASEWEEEPSDDEDDDDTFDDLQSSSWLLVVPREFANTQRSRHIAPVSPHRTRTASYGAAKAIESRRADGSSL